MPIAVRVADRDLQTPDSVVLRQSGNGDGSNCPATLCRRIPASDQDTLSRRGIFLEGDQGRVRRNQVKPVASDRNQPRRTGAAEKSSYGRGRIWI